MLRVARSCADLAFSDGDALSVMHIAEALQYRPRFIEGAQELGRKRVLEESV